MVLLLGLKVLVVEQHAMEISQPAELVVIAKGLIFVGALACIGAHGVLLQSLLLLTGSFFVMRLSRTRRTAKGLKTDPRKICLLASFSRLSLVELPKTNRQSPHPAYHFQ